MNEQPQRPYRILLERDPASTHVSFVVPTDIDGGPDLDELASLLRDVFNADQSLTAVSLKHGNAIIGTVGRVRLLRLTQPGRTAQEGDGAILQGVPRFRALTYSCRTMGCRAVEWHIVVPDEAPLCPDGHGPLEYDR
jgi:hypothetical protein